MGLVGLQKDDEDGKTVFVNAVDISWVEEHPQSTEDNPTTAVIFKGGNKRLSVRGPVDSVVKKVNTAMRNL